MPTSTVDEVLAEAVAGRVRADELYPALASAELLFAVATGQGDQALPWTVRVDDHDHGIVCTSPAHADLLTEAPAFAVISGRDLGTRWPADLRVLINPGTPLALVMDAAAMHAVGRTQEHLSAGSAFAVGAPADPPDPALADALRGALEHVGGAHSAYLFQMKPDAGVSRLVCGLVLAEGARPAEVIPPIADAVAHQVPAAGSLDFLALDGQLLATVRSYAREIR